jgi:hypothetical protein
MRSQVAKSEVAHKLGPLDRPPVQFLPPDWKQAHVTVEVEDRSEKTLLPSMTVWERELDISQHLQQGQNLAR